MLLLYGLEYNTNNWISLFISSISRSLLFIWCLTADTEMERGQSLTAGAPGCCWSDLGPLSSLSVGLMSETFLSLASPRLSSLNILVFSCFITSIIDPWYCADITQTFSQRLDKTRLHCDGLNSNQPSGVRWGRFNYVSMLSAGATREPGPLGPGHHTGSPLLPRPCIVS